MFRVLGVYNFGPSTNFHETDQLKKYHCHVSTKSDLQNIRNIIFLGMKMVQEVVMAVSIGRELVMFLQGQLKRSEVTLKVTIAQYLDVLYQNPQSEIFKV